MTLRSFAAGAFRRLIVPAVLAVVTVGVLAVGVFPTRTYLDKRSEIAAAESRLDELETSNERARQRIEALRSDAEIERLARRDHGLARPGEETYVVLPEPTDPPRIPGGWPFNHLALRYSHN